jgi:hypothetical protein
MSVNRLGNKMFRTRAERLICIEILRFYKTSISQGVEHLQWNKFCAVVTITCIFTMYESNPI